MPIPTRYATTALTMALWPLVLTFLYLLGTGRHVGAGVAGVLALAALLARSHLDTEAKAKRARRRRDHERARRARDGVG